MSQSSPTPAATPDIIPEDWEAANKYLGYGEDEGGRLNRPENMAERRELRRLAEAFSRHRLATLSTINVPAPDEVREALKPFADVVDDLDEKHDDNWNIWESSAAMGLTAGNLRRAKAVFDSISALRGGEGE